MQKILGSLVVAIVIVVVGSSAQALAQDRSAPPAPPSVRDKKGADKGTSPPKVKVYDFSGDTIEGDLIRPEGTTVDARDFAKHSSLIRVRTNFIQEIIKSAEDL